MTDSTIHIEAVDFMVCPGCGVEIDTTELPALLDIECPQCHAPVKVAGKLANFRILDLIGAGGMGAVYLAQDDALDRRVAIKVMLSSVGQNPEMLATFRREAQAAARLNHPHVVQIYSFGEENSQPYLVMELVNAGKLDAMISSGERLDPAFVMRVGAEIAEGLAAAQSANLLHGDIKPENILFDEKHNAKLVDFGIASVLTSKQGATDDVWGTPFYIAPEKVKKHGNDVRSDIYSLGATLYHALAGKPPFDGPTVKDVIQARFGKKPQPLTELCPGIDQRVVAIVDRMMSENHFQRYPNYTSLLGDMRRYLDTVSEAAKRGPRRLFGSAAGAAAAAAATGSVPPAGATGSTAADGAAGKKKLVIVKNATTNEPPKSPSGKKLVFGKKTATSPAATDTAPAPSPAPSSPSPTPSTDQSMPESTNTFQPWTCSCGQAGNQGKFCMNCGKPVPAQEWTCAACGQAHNKGKFCMNCGAPVPAADSGAAPAPAQAAAPSTAAPAAHTGRKGIVIRSGALNAVPVTRGAAPVSVADAVQAGEAASEEPADEEQPQNNNAKLMRGCLVAVLVCVGVIIVGAVGFLGWWVSKSKKADAKATQRYELAVKYEKDIQELQAPIDQAVAAIQKYDDSVNKDIREIANLIARTMPGTKWERPSLEPPAPVAPESPENAENPESPETPAPVEDVTPAAPLHPIVAEAAKMLEPAKAIRAKLREAESIRDRDPNTYGAAVKKETMTAKDFNDRESAYKARAAELETLKASIEFCRQQEIAFKRLRPGFDKIMARIKEEAAAAVAAREREEAAEKERRAAQAAAEKEREKAAAEVEKAKDYAREQQELVAKHDYAKALETLERKRAQFFTKEGIAEIEGQAERMRRLASLREFLAKDLHEKGLRQWSPAEITDADNTAITLKNGQKLAWDTLPVGSWVKLTQALLANREPVRAINTIEHGEQLFNTALFMLAHGAGNDSARKLAIDYAKKALAKRSALRKDVSRLMHEIEEEVFAVGEDDAGLGL